MKSILIIANARRSGGLSGSDNIYLNLAKHSPPQVLIWDMMNIEFSPFAVCYIYRVLVSIWYALKWKQSHNMVYSASDFWMDSIPAVILKWRGKTKKWVAGYYLFAPRENKMYYYSQKLSYWLIKKYADIVCITNDTMKHAFKDKRTISVNGGIDLSLCVTKKDRLRIYDAVFCGRIHPTKGIDDLIDIWAKVIDKKPEATMALIGDGDLGTDYIRGLMYKHKMVNQGGITLFGFQDDDRYEIYKSSKVVLYPAKTHFSMAPIEAMACGCPMITYISKTMNHMKPAGTMFAADNDSFAKHILNLLRLEKEFYYYDKQQQAIAYANTWDWEKNAKRIWDELQVKI